MCACVCVCVTRDYFCHNQADVMSKHQDTHTHTHTEDGQFRWIYDNESFLCRLRLVGFILFFYIKSVEKQKICNLFTLSRNKFT